MKNNKKRQIQNEPVPQKLDQKSNDWEVGFFMAKYSFEFKKSIVFEYLNGNGGYDLDFFLFGT